MSKIFKDIRKLDLKGKKVFLRVDYNVSFNNGVISDYNRIDNSFPTINYLINQGARIIISSHLGRVKTPEDKKKYNLIIVKDYLEKSLNKEIFFVDELVGKKRDEVVNKLEDGQILLLQNSRYEEGETKNSIDLSKELAKNIDVYINDAFGTMHRAHSTTYGIVEVMRKENKPVAYGFLVEKEIEKIDRLINNPTKPYVAILGGFKISDKIKLISGLIEEVDYLIIGGAMSYTFLKAKGVNIGSSVYEEELVEFAKDLLEKYSNKIILPIDHIVVDEKDHSNIPVKTFSENIFNGSVGKDIGYHTLKHFTKYINKAMTIFWNGPLGQFEIREFSEGTKHIAKIISKNKKAYKIVGGGDSVSAINEFKLSKGFDHLSTGGGAMLEYIEKRGNIPGISILGYEDE